MKQLIRVMTTLVIVFSVIGFAYVVVSCDNPTSSSDSDNGAEDPNNDNGNDNGNGTDPTNPLVGSWIGSFEQDKSGPGDVPFNALYCKFDASELTIIFYKDTVQVLGLQGAYEYDADESTLSTAYTSEWSTGEWTSVEQSAEYTVSFIDDNLMFGTPADDLELLNAEYAVHNELVEMWGGPVEGFWITLFSNGFYEYEQPEYTESGTWVATGTTEGFLLTEATTVSGETPVSMRGLTEFTVGDDDGVATLQLVVPGDDFPLLHKDGGGVAISEVGQGGGLVFYDKGYYSDGWRYLEAAPAGWSGNGDDPNLRWSNIIDAAVGTTSETIGTGWANTNAIINQAGHMESAAQRCRDYDGGGFTDWFLPSQESVIEMYNNLHVSGWGGFASYNYWSSSESTMDQAYHYHFLNAASNDSTKQTEIRVRPVRAF